jgi:hypothetical protein
MGIVRAFTRISVAPRSLAPSNGRGRTSSAGQRTRVPTTRSVGTPTKAFSGAKADRLKQRRKLLDEIESGDTLAVAKVDRLARNERDLLDIVQHREDIGASVTSTEQGISSEGPYGRFMLVMLGGIAEIERGIISECHRAARASFLAQGRYGAGQLPYGFHAVKDEDKGRLVVRPHPEQGPRLRQGILNVISDATLASQAEALSMPGPPSATCSRTRGCTGFLRTMAACSTLSRH